MDMNSRFEMDSFEQMIDKRQLGSNQKVQKYIDSETLRRSEDYIPKDTGAAIESGRENTKIGSGVIQYSTPYINQIYNNPAGYSGSPMRGNRWLERMKIDHSGSILSGAAKIAGGRHEK